MSLSTKHYKKKIYIYISFSKNFKTYLTVIWIEYPGKYQILYEYSWSKDPISEIIMFEKPLRM